MISIVEQTREQIANHVGSISGNMLQYHRRLTYRKIREMRKDPTIKLARMLSLAPILAAEWSIDAVGTPPEGAVDFIKAEIMGHREDLLRTSLYGCNDYGWQPYEKIWCYRPAAGYIGIRKIKPLLQDCTEVMVVENNGAFAGLRNSGVELGMQNSLLVNQDVEGTNWYGTSTFEAVEGPYDDWNKTNRAANEYAEKIAGSHWIIWYPVGKTEMNGVMTENSMIANAILSTLQANGSFAIPKQVQGFVDDLNKNSGKAWEIDLKETNTATNASYNDRLGYCDKLKVRAFGLPERAVIEGEFGTKAEAEAHADFALVAMELRHKLICQQFNWHLINQILRMNFGPEAENTVVIKPAPVVDATLQLLRTLYTAFFATPEGAATESQQVNWKSIRERLGVPTLKDEEIPADDDDSDEYDDLIRNITKGLQVIR